MHTFGQLLSSKHAAASLDAQHLQQHHFSRYLSTETTQVTSARVTQTGSHLWRLTRVETLQRPTPPPYNTQHSAHAHGHTHAHSALLTNNN